MPDRRNVLLGALAVLALGLTPACSRSGSTDGVASTTSPGVAPPTTPTGSAPTTEVADRPEVTSSGSAPRRTLRFHLTSGTTELVDITTDLGVTEVGATGPQTVDPPPIVQTVRFEVGDLRTDGSAGVTFEVVGAEVGRGNALTAAQQLTYTAALAELKGIGGRGRLSPVGLFSDVQLTMPAGVGPSVRAQVDTLRSQITRLAPVLPSEEVGVGASWTSDATTVLGGATVTQSVTTTVTAIDGDRVTYTSTIRTRAARQTLTLDGLPAGPTATLASSELTGTGSGTLDLAAIASPSMTSASGTQVIELSDPAGAMTATTTQQITVATRTEPRS